MNRMYKQFRLGLENRVVDLYCVAAIGATGAPTINASLSKGVTSITRNSTGRYTIVLDDNYIDLLQVTEFRILAAGAPAAVGGFVVRANNVAAAAKSVVVEFVNSSGAAVEINNGTSLRIKLELKASTV